MNYYDEICTIDSLIALVVVADKKQITADGGSAADMLEYLIGRRDVAAACMRAEYARPLIEVKDDA